MNAVVELFSRILSDPAAITWTIWLGFGLLVWLIFDLISGAVYLHREIERAVEPGLYWFGIFIWAAVAASCFIYG